VSGSFSPWATGPFELLIHAEGHLRSGEDFDRRLALIGFDNALEVAIATYLALQPMQRGGRAYARADVARWMSNFHSKLDYLELELTSRKLDWVVQRAHIIWTHDQRNGQYHGGQGGTPELKVLDISRAAALWVFGLLFEVADTEGLVKQELLDRTPPAPPQQDERYNAAIDVAYGVLNICDAEYPASEAVFSVDYAAYRELGESLCAMANDLAEDEG